MLINKKTIVIFLFACFVFILSAFAETRYNLENKAQIWDKIHQYFTPPDEFKGDFGEYKSVMEFYDGSKVKTAEDWQKRRQEIIEFWSNIMGQLPPLIDNPKIRVIEEEHVENFTRKKVLIELAPESMQVAYLLIPDGKEPFPAVLDVFYGPEGGAGIDEKARLKYDFGYQMTKRGFVARSEEHT